MSACSVINCHNRVDKGFRVFTFPTDPVRRKLWAINCHRGQWEPTRNSRICEVHFEESQFEQNRQDGWKKLKMNAVPTIFIVQKSTLLKKTKLDKRNKL